MDHFRDIFAKIFPQGGNCNWIYRAGIIHTKRCAEAINALLPVMGVREGIAGAQRASFLGSLEVILFQIPRDTPHSFSMRSETVQKAK